MKPSLSKLAAVLQHFFSEKTFGGRRAGRKPVRFLDCRPRRATRIFGIAGVFACEIRANPGNFGGVLIIPCGALHERRRKPTETKYKTDKFFVGVYALVAAMVVLQIAIIAWGAVS